MLCLSPNSLSAQFGWCQAIMREKPLALQSIEVARAEVNLVYGSKPCCCERVARGHPPQRTG